MYKIGLSSCNKELSEQLFADYQRAGITHMEISPAMNQYGKHDEMDYKEIESWAKKYEVCLWSYHLPFSNPYISSLEKEARQSGLEYHSELIAKGAEIGIRTFIIHPSTEPVMDETRSEQMKYSKEGLAELAERAKKCGAVIAVEDLPRSCLGRNSDEILELISAHPELRVCFDTNHLLKESNLDFLQKVGSKIITTHISDYDYIDEKHLLPGEGQIDWNQLYEAFKAINYNGVWLYELGFQSTRVIHRDRDLVCEDFVRNAQEIFEGKKLTVLGTPVHV